jgi:hypothetical protein
MPDLRTLTDYVIVATATLLALYDVVIRIVGGNEATLSARMQVHGYRWPIIVGAVCGLVCHCWWPVWSSQVRP